MHIAALVEQLASSMEDDRKAAQERLIAAGEAAVDPVLRALRDETSPIEWSTSASVLRRIGDPAFGPLVDALASAPTKEVARRCGWAFSGLAVSDKSVYASALTHPSSTVRANATYALQLMKEEAEPYLPALAGLLDDPDADVRQRAVWAIGDVGWGAVPLLRRIRHCGGRKRRAALTALADIGGWDALDEADKRAVTRLIEVKAAHEVPAPMHLCGSWYALPTTDQAAVLDAFELAMPRTVTMRLGESAWNYDHHHWSSAAHSDCRRMYVTPALNGWTLVFGKMPAVAHADPEQSDAVWRADALRRCAALSTRFGSAHWYGASCGDGWTAWCLAESGQVVRYYDVFEPDEQIGDSHAAEAGHLLPHVDAFPEGAFDGVPLSSNEAFFARYQQVKRELNIPDEAHATTVAARASVDPSELGPSTTVVGRGVIALTACGVGEGDAPGALAI